MNRDRMNTKASGVGAGEGEAPAPTPGRWTWRERLGPFASEYSVLLEQWAIRLRALSDDDLGQLGRDLTRPSTTNCWWAYYELRGPLGGCVGQETMRRAAPRKKRAAS